MTLEDLVGTLTLSGVDRATQGEAHALRFCLNGTVYQVTEDEIDGYRSALGEIKVVDVPIVNRFTPVVVRAQLKGEILSLIDVQTEKPVVEVGTEDYDDYYPCFVANWFPENLCLNVCPSCLGTGRHEEVK
jgi:hypothetical protein